jgi:hypothetical protein
MVNKMQAEEKLEEARYFLRLLNATPQDIAHEREFMHLVSAFLSSWRSVLDVMLYDYSDKYHFGFSRDEAISIRDFGIAARVTNNSQALQFLTWFKEQTGTLSNNPLSTKRNIIVHRGYPTINRVYAVYISGSMTISSSSTVQSANQPAVGSGAIPPTAGAPCGSATPTTTPTTVVADIRFMDCQNQSVLSYCTQALTQMETIVNSAIQQFGR